jgi:chemotaxis signal transduction protein
MKIAYTDHAKERMRQRGITMLEVEHVLTYPTRMQNLPEGKKRILGTVNNREVIVLSSDEENYIKVITVM